MSVLKLMDTSILSFIVLVFMYINSYRRSDKFFINSKIFILLLQTNMVLIIIDILSWAFNKLDSPLNMFYNYSFNLLLFIVEPLVPMLWIFYVSYQLFHDEEQIKKYKIPLGILFFINSVASVSSIFTGLFFNIDSLNIYQRGEFYWIHILFTYSLLIYSIYIIIKNRKSIEKSVFYSLIQFPIPITIGATIQVFHYGASYAWSGMMLSLLIVYFNIQDRSLNTDYLTGVYNRRQLDNYIKSKIKTSSKKSSFSAILLDINNFKEINDNFGHDVGDDALKDAVEIIKKSLRQNDMVARYGGDEFLIIMDINNYNILKNTVERIKVNTNYFNTNNKKPYHISFSMGYAIYDYRSKTTFDDFFRHIDQLMYCDKTNSN